ncbi:unnamed protein product [Leptidea sinapis]|uniref:Endonuclease/exonuclease/phosphatase domain-containing protein n=1 Tax=Leptidea sinapis TaxID=189913 RepID=A0A5E4QGX4_9NEOP|nr:unnamed protein product [Leptidea sinapis]
MAILWDINIDIKSNSTDRCSDYYLTSTAALGLLPAHTFPSRIHNCFDHILLKTNLTKAIVLDSPITDHLPIMLCIDRGQLHHGDNSNRTRTSVDYEGQIILTVDQDLFLILGTNATMGMVTRELERGSQEARYYQDMPPLQLGNFRPFDLDEWWGRRLIQSINRNRHRS